MDTHVNIIYSNQ